MYNIMYYMYIVHPQYHLKIVFCILLSNRHFLLKCVNSSGGNGDLNFFRFFGIAKHFSSLHMLSKIPLTSYSFVHRPKIDRKICNLI